jgi:hypothetical protein
VPVTLKPATEQAIQDGARALCRLAWLYELKEIEDRRRCVAQRDDNAERLAERRTDLLARLGWSQ